MAKIPSVMVEIIGGNPYETDTYVLSESTKKVLDEKKLLHALA